MTACYLDASALVKLVADEAESQALREHLGSFSARLTSRIATVEVPRALSRKGPESSALAGELVVAAFEGVSVIELDTEISKRAALLLPATLRSLDAIHLASALSLREELTVVVTYDARFAEAARGAGLTVMAPA